jgi:hypothetical protein
MTPEAKEAFLRIVLGWLQRQQGSRDARTVVSAVATGGEDGSTDAGWFPTCELQIEWTDPDGRHRTTRVDGEDLASLWNTVMGNPSRW